MLPASDSLHARAVLLLQGDSSRALPFSVFENKGNFYWSTLMDRSRDACTWDCRREECVAKGTPYKSAQKHGP